MVLAGTASLVFELFFLTFNLHIAKFAGLEHFAAFFALDVFRVLVAGDDPYSGVGAGCIHERIH